MGLDLPIHPNLSHQEPWTRHWPVQQQQILQLPLEANLSILSPLREQFFQWFVRFTPPNLTCDNGWLEDDPGPGNKLQGDVTRMFCLGFPIGFPGVVKINDIGKTTLEEHLKRFNRYPLNIWMLLTTCISLKSTKSTHECAFIYKLPVFLTIITISFIHQHLSTQNLGDTTSKPAPEN